MDWNALRRTRERSPPVGRGLNPKYPLQENMPPDKSRDKSRDYPKAAYVGPYWFVQDGSGSVLLIGHRCALADAEEYGDCLTSRTAITISGRVGEQAPPGRARSTSYAMPSMRSGRGGVSCSTSSNAASLPTATGRCSNTNSRIGSWNISGFLQPRWISRRTSIIGARGLFGRVQTGTVRPQARKS